MKISLVIPAYNEGKYIGACLETVQKNGKGLFETIVINNASTDHTVDVVSTFPFAKIIDEPAKGLTKARQRGLVSVSGDIIAFIDADTQMPSGWLEKIVREFESDANLVCLSGPYKYYDSSFLSSIGNWLYWVFLAWPTYIITGYMAVGGNFAARRSALERIGGFDSNIQFYGEDTDIARRLSGVGKVKFKLNFYMHTSARRLQAEGLVATGYRYVVNFMSIVWSGKPHDETYNDIR